MSSVTKKLIPIHVVLRKQQAIILLKLEGHMKSCVIERIQAEDHEVIDELLTTVNKLMK